MSFADEAGSAIRAPFNADWPLETHSKVAFAEHAAIGKGTVVTVEWTAINASERKVLRGGHDSMLQGWTGTMEQLETYPASA